VEEESRRHVIVREEEGSEEGSEEGVARRRERGGGSDEEVARWRHDGGRVAGSRQRFRKRRHFARGDVCPRRMAARLRGMRA